MPDITALHGTAEGFSPTICAVSGALLLAIALWDRKRRNTHMTCGLTRTLGAAASCSSSAARPQRCAAAVSTRSSCWPSAPSRCCLARQLRCQARIEPYGTDDEWYDIIDTHPSRPLTAQQPSRPGSTAGSRARSAGASPVPALSLEEQVAELRQIVERQQRIINKLLDADSPPSRCVYCSSGCCRCRAQQQTL